RDFHVTGVQTCALPIFTPQVREDIMAYIAPRLKEKYGLNLAVEPIGSAPMLERILIQRDNPRATIPGWDEPIGIHACEMGLCSQIGRASGRGRGADELR